VKRSHLSIVFVLCALCYVELASGVRLWARAGDTTFGHFPEAMAFLGPWNALSSPVGIGSSELAPLLSIFLAPVVLALGVAWAAEAVHRKFGGWSAAALIAALAVAHVASGLMWGLARWGP
jgi:hypothetical protein